MLEHILILFISWFALSVPLGLGVGYLLAARVEEDDIIYRSSSIHLHKPAGRA